MPEERRLLAYFDWLTLALILLITTLSLLLLYSATATQVKGVAPLFVKQLVWLGIGLMGLAAVLCCDYQLLCRYAYVLYGVLLLGLVAVLLTGPVINGAQRWLVVGPWRFQVSELAKPVLILVLARYLTEEREASADGLTLREVLVPLALVVPPFLLIAKQPDLSTSLLLFAILGIMVVMAGIRRQTLLALSGLALAALPVAWLGLKHYQRQRLLAMLNPNTDLQGVGYHGLQSKIAIGSGGLWGKGWFAGTQSHLHFLPEKHTDFIFAVLGEEWGFAGVCVLLGLFCLLCVHGLTTAARARDRLGALIATGVVSLLALQVFLNVGMTIGLLPVIGLPLPLVSYGGVVAGDHPAVAGVAHERAHAALSFLILRG
ncbi:MAG: rod shape-determining protein RodA [Candidatus Tectimicrobiota bacterium]|nr:MAG: rod shape-determining protein RodA [Candidatus Tectomicrobia bacterium]